MDTHALLDAGSLFGCIIDFLGGAGVHGPAGIFAGEQVERLAERFSSKGGVPPAVGAKESYNGLSGPSLLDTDHLALTVEIGPLQGNDLAQAQTGGIGRPQQSAVFGEVGGGKQPLQLLVAENLCTSMASAVEGSAASIHPIPKSADRRTATPKQRRYRNSRTDRAPR